MKTRISVCGALCMLAALVVNGTSVVAQQPAPAPARPPLPVKVQPAKPLAPIAPASTYRSEPAPGALSARLVAYTIKAKLDPVEKSVAGSQRVSWRNPSDVPVSELQFHLYLNAFREGSTFIKESGGQLRGDQMQAGKYGQIDVTALKTASGEDLLPVMEFIHPDDDNTADKTVARVPLTQPVPPGGTIEIDMEFLSKLPEVFARTGYKENFFLVAQWFPKLGVFEPRGMRGRAEPGWNTHQFHANSEFYADFGVYDVEIDVPSNYVVGATGRRVAERPSGDGRTVHHFQQEDVHDFAWTADDNYVVGKRTYEEPGFPAVEITALVQPEHAATVDRHLDIGWKSLSWFNKNVGAYPYQTLTIVDPEQGGGGAGGMEYPTFITAGIASMSPGTLPEEDDPLLEIVTFHEFGHQYWYGLVASNEFEEPWMDEGINSYTEMLGMEELWPEKDSLYVAYGGVNVFKMPVENLFSAVTRAAALPFVTKSGPLIHKAWGYKGDYNYGVNTYQRTAIALRTLEAYVGEETMRKILQTYFERWKFRHPTSQDFFDTASEVAGEDLSWFFDQYFRSATTLDYAVESVEAKDGKTEVVLERTQDGVFPVTARVTREDGSTEEIAWDGLAAQEVFTLEAGSPVARVELFPSGKVLLDANQTNNSWMADRDIAGPARVASQWGLFFQHALVLLSGAV
jgi:hypothetical protein